MKSKPQTATSRFSSNTTRDSLGAATMKVLQLKNGGKQMGGAIDRSDAASVLPDVPFATPSKPGTSSTPFVTPRSSSKFTPSFSRAANFEEKENHEVATSGGGFGQRRRPGARLPGLSVSVSPEDSKDKKKGHGEQTYTPISTRTRSRMQAKQAERGSDGDVPLSSGISSMLERALKLRGSTTGSPIHKSSSGSPLKRAKSQARTPKTPAAMTPLKTPLGKSAKKLLALSGRKNRGKHKDTEVVSGKAAREAFFGARASYPSPQASYFGEDESQAGSSSRFLLRQAGPYRDFGFDLGGGDSYCPDSARIRGTKLGFDGDIVKAHSLLAYVLDGSASGEKVDWKLHQKEWLRCERDLQAMIGEALNNVELLLHDLRLWPRWYDEIQDSTTCVKPQMCRQMAEVIALCTRTATPLVSLLNGAEAEQPPSPLSQQSIILAMQAGQGATLTNAFHDVLSLAQRVVGEAKRQGEESLVLARRADLDAAQRLSPLIDSIRTTLRDNIPGRVAAENRWKKGRAMLPAMRLQPSRPLFARDSILVQTLRRSLAVPDESELSNKKRKGHV
mmetsp:Transcript_61277/g.144215  ORF Transcript_61277/g.144215 Transcript_61277/m.144215 type:complete len:561 (-) Transcript_61277:176-1858(-)